MKPAGQGPDAAARGSRYASRTNACYDKDLRKYGGRYVQQCEENVERCYHQQANDPERSSYSLSYADGNAREVEGDLRRCFRYARAIAEDTARGEYAASSLREEIELARKHIVPQEMIEVRNSPEMRRNAKLFLKRCGIVDLQKGKKSPQKLLQGVRIVGVHLVPGNEGLCVSIWLDVHSVPNIQREIAQGIAEMRLPTLALENVGKGEVVHAPPVICQNPENPVWNLQAGLRVSCLRGAETFIFGADDMAYHTQHGVTDERVHGAWHSLAGRMSEGEFMRRSCQLFEASKRDRALSRRRSREIAKETLRVGGERQKEHGGRTIGLIVGGAHFIDFPSIFEEEKVNYVGLIVSSIPPVMSQQQEDFEAFERTVVDLSLRYGNYCQTKPWRR